MTIKNPTRDAETFTRQFARIKARDAERASRIQNAPIQAETEVSRAEMSFEEWTDLMFNTLCGAYRIDPVEDVEALLRAKGSVNAKL